MIPKELQMQLEKQYNSQQGQKDPCSNQIVDNFIIAYREDGYFHHFIDLLNGKYIYTNKLYDLNQVLLPSGEYFYVINNYNLCRLCRGYRFYKIFIDSRIEKDYLYEYILPYCSSYCHMLKFF